MFLIRETERKRERYKISGMEGWTEKANRRERAWKKGQQCEIMSVRKKMNGRERPIERGKEWRRERGERNGGERERWRGKNGGRDMERDLDVGESEGPITYSPEWWNDH